MLVAQADRALIPLEVVGPEEAVVHEARKASKRARAVGRLVRPLVDGSIRVGLDHAFRDAARLLGPLRDADVARKNLGEHAPPRPDGEGIGKAAVAAYRLARTRAEALELDSASHDHLLQGLAASWRGARSATKQARAGDPESFHEWRKAVKRLYYQVQLVDALQPAVLGGLASQLDVLQESLGDHHDTVVGVQLAAPDAPGVAELQARRQQLEAETLPLGRWLFAASSKRFVAWIAARLDGR